MKEQALSREKWSRVIWWQAILYNWRNYYELILRCAGKHICGEVSFSLLMATLFGMGIGSLLVNALKRRTKTKTKTRA